MLAAIFEEEGSPRHSPREASQPSLGASTPVDNLHAAVGDDEGRRICELLVRFDPIRLRAEFQQLYLHRLHYQPHQQCMTLDTLMESRFSESEVVAPEIDAQSRAIAEKVIERQRGESTVPLNQHADLLLWRHTCTEARKDERRKQAHQDEVSACTFKPKMTAKPHDMPLEVTPRGASRNEVLYAKGQEAGRRKQAKAEEESRARSKNEVKDCTFKPDTGKSERSYHRAHDGAAPVPRGFYESRQRVRAAVEVQAHKSRQKEDRLSKITQPGVSTSSPSSVPLSSPAIGEHLLHPLAPVAEDARLQDVVRAPGPGVKSKSPRPPGGRQAGGAGGRSAEQARPRGASPAADARQAQRGTPNLREAFLPPRRDAAPAAAPGGSEDAGSTVPASPQSATAGGPATGSQSSPELADGAEPPPLLYVDVNIAPNQPPERIVLREGQSVTEVAADFAAKHVLTPALAQRLHALLREVLQRQEQRP